MWRGQNMATLADFFSEAIFKLSSVGDRLWKILKFMFIRWVVAYSSGYFFTWLSINYFHGLNFVWVMLLAATESTNLREKNCPVLPSFLPCVSNIKHSLSLWNHKFNRIWGHYAPFIFYPLVGDLGAFGSCFGPSTPSLSFWPTSPWASCDYY